MERSPLAHLRRLVEAVVTASSSREVQSGDEVLVDAWQEVLAVLVEGRQGSHPLGPYHYSQLIDITRRGIKASFRTDFIVRHPGIAEHVTNVLCQVHNHLSVRIMAIGAIGQVLRALSEHITVSTANGPIQNSETDLNSKVGGPTNVNFDANEPPLNRLILRTAMWIVGRLAVSFSLERDHGWNSDISVERVHLILSLIHI